MKGKIEWLKQGYFVLLPELDELGRTIMYVIVWALPFYCSHHVHILTFNMLLSHRYGDASKMPEDQAVEEVVKVWWYLVHVAMERPSCRKVSWWGVHMIS